MPNEQLKKHIHRELTGASVKIFEQVGNNYEFRGTGFFITPDGYLLTAYHCVKDAPGDIYVKTHFDGQFKAVLDQRKSLRDSEYDIAVLKIDYQPNHYLPLGIVTDEHITDEIVAVGYPAGHKPENTHIKTFIGKISGFRTDNKIENVGTQLVLEDFTLEQVADLNQRYGTPLNNNEEIKRFHQLVGGQPYLVRCGLNDIVSHQLTLDAFISKAEHDDGTYGDHLRRIVMSLNREEPLLQAMQGVLHGKACPDYDTFYRLRSAGILRGDSKDNVSLRCEIYGNYLKKHLL